MFNKCLIFPLRDCWSHCRNSLCLCLVTYITHICYSLEYILLGSSKKILIWSVHWGKLGRGFPRSSHNILVIVSRWTTSQSPFLISHPDHPLSLWNTGFSDLTAVFLKYHHHLPSNNPSILSKFISYSFSLFIPRRVHGPLLFTRLENNFSLLAPHSLHYVHVISLVLGWPQAASVFTSVLFRQITASENWYNSVYLLHFEFTDTKVKQILYNAQ